MLLGRGSPLQTLLWLFGRRSRIRVRGDSMRPTLPDGAIVFIDDRAYVSQRPAVGDVVVAWHPHIAERRIVKRVDHHTEDGRVYLKGDNPAASTDSGAFGAVETQRIVGRVVGRFPRRLGG